MTPTIKFTDCNDGFSHVLYLSASDCEIGDECKVIMIMLIAESICVFNFLGLIDQAGMFVPRHAVVKRRGLTLINPPDLVTIALNKLDECCLDDNFPGFVGGAYDPLTIMEFDIDGAITAS